MMTPSKFHDDDDGYSASTNGSSSQSYTALTRSSGSSTMSVSSSSICSLVSFYPLQAAQRMFQCFGYTHTVKLQSGRTVIVGAEIAQGGYSYVYHARDAATGEAFALKKILCQNQEQMAMAKQEIETHRSFLHVNLMPLSDYAVVSVDAQTHEYYLLFPYMENGTLREMIDVALSRRMPIPERVILDIFLKVCRAVGEMHARSPPLVHRDIKPENVLLTRDDEPVLTDFGSVAIGEIAISKRSDALLLQESAAQFSSMPYRAPELYDVGDNTHITPRTDVWSLGCLLYAMAFGYSPFECAFTDSGELKIVECSYLAVIGIVKFPKNHSRSTSLLELIRMKVAALRNECAEKEVPLENVRHRYGRLIRQLGLLRPSDQSPPTSYPPPTMLHMNGHDSHTHSHSHPHASAGEPESPGGTPPMNGAEGSTRCDCCKSCGAILELEGCGHRFHPRCIYSFPMVQCELCSVPVGTVKIFRVFRNSSNSMVRKGKWSSDEHKYANMMMKQFQMGALPLVDGLHLRGFIANLLQCDPLRVTKKYSGHAIGKQNFFFQHHKSYCYNLHTKMQKRISSLRNHFYWHIQYRCKFGYSMNIQELKAAEADYWIREFLKFANKTGQRVELAPAPVAVESPVPSLVQEREESEPPVQLAASVAVGREAASVVKIELAASSPPYTSPPPQPVLPVAPESPTFASRAPLTVNTAEDLDMDTQIESPAAAAALLHPSFKLDGHGASSPPLGAVSPLSFDEWREEEAPSFMDVLDKALIADFAKQSGSAQFSATLSEILGSSSSSGSSSNGSGSGMALPSLAQTVTAIAGTVNASATATTTATANSRCSLRDWLLEEDSRWSDSMAGNSWSFSFPLSDCA